MNDAPTGPSRYRKKLGGMVGLWLLLVLFNIQFSFGFFDAPAVFVLLFGLGIGVAFFCAGIPYALAKKSPKLLIDGVVIVLFMLSATAASGWLLHVQREQTLALGDQVALALEYYRDDHGGYPAGLTDLSPRYLEMIPATRMGLAVRWPFVYDSGSPERYTLDFDAGFGSMCGRVAGRTQWDCFD